MLQGGKPPMLKRGEVVHMTVYEAISLMISFGTLIIALLAYIDRKNRQEKAIAGSGRILYTIFWLSFL